MELRNYLAIVARYWRPLIVIPIVAALTALLATFVVSPRFEGVVTTQVIPEEVEPRAISLRSQDGPSTVAIGLKDPTELLSQGIIENLGSREVVEAVVDELGMDQWPEPQGFAAFKSRVRGAISDAWTYAQHGYVVHPSRREGAIYAVGQSLDAELVRGSYYMRVTARWDDPEVASDIANTAVVAVVDHIRNVANRSAKEQSTFLATQVRDARQRADAARTDLITYSETSGTVGYESLRLALDAQQRAREAVQSNALDLAAVSSQLQEAQKQLGETDPRVVTSRTNSGTTNQDSGSRFEQTSLNPSWEIANTRVRELEQDVAALENSEWFSNAEAQAALEANIVDTRQRLDKARQQLEQGKLSQLVKDQLKEQILTLEQQISALEGMRGLNEDELRLRREGQLTDARRRLDIARQQLDGTPANVLSVQRSPASSNSTSSSSETSELNPVFQDLQQSRATLSQQASALRAQQAQLTDELRAREADVRQLTSQDAKLAAFNQDLELATNVYSRRVEQWNDAVLESVRPVTQLRLIDPSIAPIYPVRPIKWRWTLIGLAAGLVVAIVLVFVRHSTDIRVRSAADAEAALALTMLAVVPRTRQTASI